MTQLFEVHPASPQRRLLRRAAAIVLEGGVIVYPTDSGYALGCLPGDRSAVERMRRLRRVDDRHELTLVCRDLSALAGCARVDNPQFRLLKALTPGPYTFVLKASADVPRRLCDPRRRTVGLRVPDHTVARALLEELDGPLLSTSLILEAGDAPLVDPVEMRERLRGRVELVIDAGACATEPTSVVDLTEQPPRVLRRGQGDLQVFQA